MAQFADTLYDWEILPARYETQSGEWVGNAMRVAIVLGKAARYVRESFRAQLGSSTTIGRGSRPS